MPTDVTEIAPNEAASQVGVRISATRMTFVLSLFCLAILGYAAIAYVYFSFHQVGAAPSIPLFVVRQRTALSALAMMIALSCVIMGFAVFMIGAKGEINFKAESSWARGALVSGVPGPFFVLCGTIITVAVLLARVSYEQGAISAINADPVEAGQLQPGQQRQVPEQPPGVGQSTPQSNPATVNPPSRTIASSATQRMALYTDRTAIYNDLFSIAEDVSDPDAVRHLITNEEDLSVVLINWDDQNKRPVSFQGTDQENRNTRVNVSAGYLFVLDSNWAGTVKDLLKAANGVSANFPKVSPFSVESVAKVLKAALTSRSVFRHGETAD